MQLLECCNSDTTFGPVPNMSRRTPDKGETKMSAIRGSDHSKYPGLLPIEPRDDFLCPIDLEPEPIDLKPERIDLTPEDVLFPNWEPPAHKRPRVLARFPIAFCTGVAGAWLWLSYGDAARETIANSYRQLGWSAPRPASTAQNPRPTDVIGLAAPAAPSAEKLNAMSFDLDAVGQNKIATTIAARREPATRNTNPHNN